MHGKVNGPAITQLITDLKDKLTAQEKRLFQDIDKPHHGLHDE